MPWDEVSIGGAFAVSGLISLLKRLGMPSAFAPWVTWAAGFVWLVLARVAGGQDWLSAAFQAAVVVFSAPGFYELVSKRLGKRSSPSS